MNFEIQTQMQCAEMKTLKLPLKFITSSDSIVLPIPYRVNPPQNKCISLHPFPKSLLLIHISPQLNRLKPIACHYIHSPSSDSSSPDNYEDSRFYERATWTGLATLISKFLGLVREIVMAAVFGVGPVVNAFKYASVLPGFALSLIGGVNGPIHVTMATTLSKLPKERRKKLFQHANALMLLIGCALGALVFAAAEFFIHIYAPGLWILHDGGITKEIAILQLRIMVPCIVLAGPIGLGFGYMSAEQNNALPSISPALSSMLMIALLAMHSFMKQSNYMLLGEEVSGGILIASSASLGAFLQWILQVVALAGRQHNVVSTSWMNMSDSKDIHEFFSLLLPATVSSSIAQVASFTDLCFASHIPGAAAGLSYAYLLAMAPLGLLSSIIKLPLLTTFSKLSKVESWPSLMDNLKQGILLSMVVLLPIVSVMCSLAKPIIHVLFERISFDSAASALVSSSLISYSFGSPFYIVRELLVVVFYALGDAKLPFLVSMGAIFLNAILDWCFVSKYHLGAQGLALSTSFTTALTVIILLHLLQKKLAGIVDYADAICPLLLMVVCAFISVSTSSIAYRMIHKVLPSILIPRLQELLSILFASVFGMTGFFSPLLLLHYLGFQQYSHHVSSPRLLY